MENTRTRQISIGGNTYTITVLSAKKGIKVGTEILQIIAPVIGAILDDGGNSEVNFDGSTLFTEISLHLMNNVKSDHIVELVDILLASLYKNSNTVSYDDEFAGKYSDLIQLLEFTLKENFSDFFTNYFKAKGFEIPTLKELMERVAPTEIKSENELSEPAQ